ncbi:MAG TPA: DNA helicase II, partial [Pseudomonas sp.]|nr:DNA helicase II [Pseudomonas sp.]
MARFFPARSQCQFDTPGERRFAERLEKLLEDDYLCWSNVPLGPRSRYPDFVVLHPRRGVLVLEVKDWKLDTLASITPNEVRLYTQDGLKTQTNPFLQARVCVLEVTSVLKKDPLLRQGRTSPRPGELIMPWGWGVVLTRINRRQFEQANLDAVLDPQRVICQDEMTEAADSETFQQRLWNMFPHVFPCALSLPQIDRVRYHLFPEVRVNSQPGQFGLFDAADAPLPSLIKVMDLQQEQLARSLGDGHRVIHGAAGSGKTMILGYRCAHLAKVSVKPILVLCYNKSLAGRLRQVIEQKGLGERVVVQNFHAWCAEMLTAYQVDKPDQRLPVAAKMEQYVLRTID